MYTRYYHEAVCRFAVFFTKEVGSGLVLVSCGLVFIIWGGGFC